jgi:hypothetical protein
MSVQNEPNADGDIRVIGSTGIRRLAMPGCSIKAIFEGLYCELELDTPLALLL